jgi:hypothetical protein
MLTSTQGDEITTSDINLSSSWKVSSTHTHTPLPSSSAKNPSVNMAVSAGSILSNPGITCSFIHNAVITLPSGDVLTSIYMDNVLLVTNPGMSHMKMFQGINLDDRQCSWHLHQCKQPP